jgi:hypothetical protein
MKVSIPIAGCALAVILLTPPAEAGGIAVTGRASTLGLGVELTAGLADRLNVRVGRNTFAVDRRLTEDGDEFDLSVQLRSLSALVDVHPFGGGFRLSGGLVKNGNEAGLIGRSTDSYEIGGATFPASQVGALIGDVDVKEVAPYAGIGWGNAVREGRKLGLVFDLGIVFQGSPRVTLRATGPIAANAAFQQELREEERSFEDDAQEFKYYPVVSLGLSYKF